MIRWRVDFICHGDGRRGGGGGGGGGPHGRIHPRHVPGVGQDGFFHFRRQRYGFFSRAHQLCTVETNKRTQSTGYTTWFFSETGHT